MIYMSSVQCLSINILSHYEASSANNECQGRAGLASAARSPRKVLRGFGWHYLSHATCLIQPHLFYACLVVSRIIICYIIRQV